MDRIKQEIARRLSEYGLEPNCLSESEYKDAYDDILREDNQLETLDGFWSTFMPFKYKVKK